MTAGDTMSTLNRIKRIVKAAVAEIIEKADDPELALSRFVEDCEMALAEVRAEIQAASIRRGNLADQAAEHRFSAQDWMARAEQAAARDQDELAKEALRRYHADDDSAQSCADLLGEVESLLTILRKDADYLAQKLDHARQEQKRLSARLRRAEAEKRSGSVLIRADREGLPHDRVRTQILDAEAAGDAAREVHNESAEARFDSLTQRLSLDQELAALKQRVKKPGGETSD
jgi:phage shock protein A